MLVKCPVCKGKGEYDVIAEDNKQAYPVKCSICDGKGKVEKAATYTGKRTTKR